MTPFGFRAVATTLGAEIESVDLAGPLDDDTIGALRAALLERKVLFFREQSLTPDGLTALARRFGEPTPAHPVEPSLPGHPEVLPLDSGEGARADVWHSDLTFQPCPPLGALLLASTVPAVGGDTLWADMAAAYEAVSDPLRGFLEGLTAAHSAQKAGGYFAQRDAAGERAARAAADGPVHHPVVRVHPETGRRSLFVNPLFTLGIDGLHRAESQALLRHLHEVATAPEHVVRWQWREGDLAFWDNRCTMHYALLDFGPAVRRMERVAIEGDRPVGVAG